MPRKPLLNLPMGFDEALSDLVKVRPPEPRKKKPVKQKRKPKKRR